MNAKKRVAVVTGSRADFGLLRPVIEELQKSSAIDVEVWVTGMHLSEHFGRTITEIEKLQFPITEKVNCLNDEDTDQANTLAVSEGLKGWAEVFQRNHPDLIIVLGDRFEILAVVQAALFSKVPVAHLCGGDVTEGAFDEAIRHSISKSAHIHFVTNEDSKQRVLQLGENPKDTFNVGSPAIDLMTQLELLSREQLQENLAIEFLNKIFLVTFHPETLINGDAKVAVAEQMDQFLGALKEFEGQATFIVTGTNADNAYSVIDKKMAAFRQNTKNVHTYQSLGQLRYWSLMSVCDAVIGNSSSGLYEAPTFKKPTVNVGDRQKGRLAAPSVIHSEASKESIVKAIKQALTMDCSSVVNPYGTGGTSAKIRQALESYQTFQPLLKKHFYNFTPTKGKTDHEL